MRRPRRMAYGQGSDYVDVCSFFTHVNPTKSMATAPYVGDMVNFLPGAGPPPTPPCRWANMWPHCHRALRSTRLIGSSLFCSAISLAPLASLASRLLPMPSLCRPWWLPLAYSTLYCGTPEYSICFCHCMSPTVAYCSSEERERLILLCGGVVVSPMAR